MSDVAQGPGWWQASDGRWYPPEALPEAMRQANDWTAAAAPDQVTEPVPEPEPEAAFAAPAHAPAHAAGPYPGPLPGAYPGPLPGAYPGAVPGPMPGHMPPTMPGVVAPYPGYGPLPAGDAAAYGWAAYPATYPAWRHRGVVGVLLVVLGLAGLVWGVGELFAALALNGSPVYPHDEQVGAWLVTAGVLLASLVTIAIGLVHRRS